MKPQRSVAGEGRGWGTSLTAKEQVGKQGKSSGLGPDARVPEVCDGGRSAAEVQGRLGCTAGSHHQVRGHLNQDKFGELCPLARSYLPVQGRLEQREMHWQGSYMGCLQSMVTHCFKSF